MTEQSVILSINENIATITLNRPEVHNAFDDEVIARLTGILDDLHANENIIATVLQSNGKSFSAGADLNWMKKAASYTEQQNKEDAYKLATMLNKLDTLPCVTIACVQGAAMGGGLGLVSCCDIVIAADRAIFALSEVKLGLIPATIAPYVLRAMGQRQARRFFVTGERFSAQHAHSIGFIHDCVADENALAEKRDEYLDFIKKNGPIAMRASKKLCLDLDGQTITDEVLHETASRIAKARSTDEAKQRLTNFLEKT